jgi:hypothetical protein
MCDKYVFKNLRVIFNVKQFDPHIKTKKISKIATYVSVIKGLFSPKLVLEWLVKEGVIREGVCRPGDGRFDCMAPFWTVEVGVNTFELVPEFIPVMFVEPFDPTALLLKPWLEIVEGVGPLVKPLEWVVDVRRVLGSTIPGVGPLVPLLDDDDTVVALLKSGKLPLPCPVVLGVGLDILGGLAAALFARSTFILG